MKVVIFWFGRQGKKYASYFKSKENHQILIVGRQKRNDADGQKYCEYEHFLQEYRYTSFDLAVVAVSPLDEQEKVIQNITELPISKILIEKPIGSSLLLKELCSRENVFYYFDELFHPVFNMMLNPERLHIEAEDESDTMNIIDHALSWFLYRKDFESIISNLSIEYKKWSPSYTIYENGETIVHKDGNLSFGNHAFFELAFDAGVKSTLESMKDPVIWETIRINSIFLREFTERWKQKKNVDLFIGLNECEGQCLFCNKWVGLVWVTESGKQSQENCIRYTPKTEAEVFKIAKKCWWSPEIITITGYEPILYPRLTELLDIIRESNPSAKIRLRTSGFIEINPVLYEKIDGVELPIYGSTEFIQNAMGGNTKAWEWLQKNIEIIQSYWFIGKIFFQTIPLRENIHDIKHILSMVDALGNQNEFRIIYPYFMPNIHMEQLLSRAEVIKTLLSELPETLRKKCTLVNFPRKPYLDNLFRSICH